MMARDRTISLQIQKMSSTDSRHIGYFLQHVLHPGGQFENYSSYFETCIVAFHRVGLHISKEWMVAKNNNNVLEYSHIMWERKVLYCWNNFPVSLQMGFRHLVPKISRTRFLDHLVPVRDGGTRWPLVVEDSTGRYAMAGRSFPAGTRWLAEVSGWYEIAGWNSPF